MVTYNIELSPREMILVKGLLDTKMDAAMKDAEKLEKWAACEDDEEWAQEYRKGAEYKKEQTELINRILKKIDKEIGI